MRLHSAERTGRFPQDAIVRDPSPDIADDRRLYFFVARITCLSRLKSVFLPIQFKFHGIILPCLVAQANPKTTTSRPSRSAWSSKPSGSSGTDRHCRTRTRARTPLRSRWAGLAGPRAERRGRLHSARASGKLSRRRRRRRAGRTSNNEVQFLLTTETLDYLCLICAFVRRRFAHFQDAAQLHS